MNWIRNSYDMRALRIALWFAFTLAVVSTALVVLT